MVLLGALSTFPPGSCLFPLYTLHHMQLPHTGSCKWPTLLVLEVLILGFDQQLFQCPIPFEMCLHTILSTNHDALSQSLHVRDDYVAYTCFFPGGPFFSAVTWSVGVLCWVFLVVIVVTLFLPVAVYVFILNILYVPPGVFALDQTFPEVFQLLI